MSNNRYRFDDPPRREPWGLPAPSNDNTAPADPTALLIVLSLIIGAGLGCAATIGAYAFHLLT